MIIHKDVVTLIHETVILITMTVDSNRYREYEKEPGSVAKRYQK